LWAENREGGALSTTKKKREDFLVVGKKGYDGSYFTKEG